jgi:hypothetical protein
MEGDQDTAANAELPKRRPLTARGKPYSDRHEPGWAESQEQDRLWRESLDRKGREAAQQAAAQYLRGLPEFSEKSEARIDKVSRGLVRAISRSTEIRTR